MSRSHFRRGLGRNVFPCECCGRRTRGQTDCIGINMCQQCYDLAGFDNQHNDDGTAPTADEMAHYNALLGAIVAKGGNADDVKALNDYIWTE